MYLPRPADRRAIANIPGWEELIETIAEQVHDSWAAERISQGWSHGPSRSDEKKQHPSLVPYAELPESEKELDRTTAIAALSGVIKAGFKLEMHHTSD